jgi:hypothetical protein
MYAVSMQKPSRQQREKPVTVKIEREIYNMVGSVVSESEGEIKKFVNELILMNIERLNLLRRYQSPFLSLIHSKDQSLFIKDSKINKVVEVKLFHIKEDKIALKCLDDNNSDSCVHIAFALALPELGKLTFDNIGVKND